VKNLIETVSFDTALNFDLFCVSSLSKSYYLLSEATLQVDDFLIDDATASRSYP
jgi:hypothetical protein